MEILRREGENNKAIKWIYHASKRERKSIILLIIFHSFQSIFSLIFALVIRQVIDSTTSGNRRNFGIYVGILCGLILFQIMNRAIIRRMDEWVRVNIENTLRKRVYLSILQRDYTSVSLYHTGELQNRMTSDTKLIADSMASIFPNLVGMSVKLIGAVIVLLMLDWRFTLVFLTGGMILLFVTYGFRRVMKGMHKQVQEVDGVVRSFLQETVGNLLVIRSFRGENQVLRMATEKMDEYMEIRMKRNLFSNLCNIGFGAVMNIGYLFGLIWCGNGILNGIISYGTLMAVLQLIGQIQQPFANMTGYLPRYYSMLASAERLIEIEELPMEIYSIDKRKERLCDELYKDMEQIQVSNLTFSYPQGKNKLSRENVLENASLSLKKGEFLAISGRSGIGKSTLLKLFLAVYPISSGKIEIYFRGEESLKLSPATRKMFAYVPQGNFLLSGTVKEAICFLCEESGEKEKFEKVQRACQIACAEEFILNLPNGYETKIGEKGEGLSEGQVQRVAIARAIYSDAPILLLDEATSALDEITERRVLKNLKQLTDKTVIIVTHRKAVFDICDTTVILKNKKFYQY